MEKVRKKSDCFYVSSQNDFVSEKSTTKKYTKKDVQLSSSTLRSWNLMQRDLGNCFKRVAVVRRAVCGWGWSNYVSENNKKERRTRR